MSVAGISLTRSIEIGPTILAELHAQPISII